MKWKAVIFDRDGTLFDSLPVILRAFNYGIEPFVTTMPTDEQWFAAFGPDEPEVMGVFIDAKHKQQAYERFFRYYRDHFHEISLFPGMRKVIENLHQNGVKLALFTGAGKETAEYCLEKEGILQYFSELVTGDVVTNPKPDPEGIYKAMKALNCQPSETIIVGDSGSDVLAGQAAGATTVLVRWGGLVPPHDLPSKPDYTFTTVHEFDEFLFL
ncbi:MAG TPA: HAD family hydrolase [Acidobacteriota bacterium]|nr:HAD family hydrolase [Acidobacteriota bacterium]